MVDEYRKTLEEKVAYYSRQVAELAEDMDLMHEIGDYKAKNEAKAKYENAKALARMYSLELRAYLGKNN